MGAVGPVGTPPLPTLFVYDYCAFCVRTRAILGLKRVDHTLVFVAYHDAATPIALVGRKQTPILQLPSGHAFAESSDIIKYIDAHYGDTVLLQDASGRADLAAWYKASMQPFWELCLPRVESLPLPELAQRPSRMYLRKSKEQRFGSFDAMRAKTPALLKVANQHLVDLSHLLFSDRFVNESGVGYDDLAVFASLRALTIVKGLVWPAKVRAYMEHYASVADVPLLNAMAQ